MNSPLVSPRSVGLAALLIAVITAIVVPLTLRDHSGTVAALVAIANASGGDRTIEARLTGGFRHAAMRSGQTGSRRLATENPKLLAAAAAAQREALSDATPSHLHDWGLSQLLLGDYDGAVSSLRFAADEAPNRAGYFSDLAASLLARSRALDHPEDVPLALEAAEHARSLGDGPEIRYNRAIAFEALHLDRLARAEWLSVLDLDSGSDWADEARERMQALAERSEGMRWDPGTTLTPQNAFRAREWWHTHAIADWARAIEDGRDGEPEFSRVEALAHELSRVTGDRIFDVIVAEISSADGEGRGWLAIGHLGLAGALSSLARPDDPRNLMRLIAAGCEGFQKAHSKLAPVCDVEDGFMRVERRDFAGALAAAEKALPFLESHGFVSSRGRALWLRGRALTALGRLTDAGAYFREAIEPFEGSMEWPSAARMKSQIADTLWANGRQRDAWSMRLAALDTIAAASEERLTVSAYLSTAAQCENERKPATAMAFAQATLDRMGDRLTAQIHFISLQRIVSAAVGLSELDRARRARDELLTLIGNRKEWSPLANNQDFQLALASLSEAEGNFVSSDQQLTSVISATLEERTLGTRLWAHINRASVRIKQGRFDVAEEDLRDAVQLLHHRTTTASVALRIGDLGRIRQLAAQLVFEKGHDDGRGLVLFDGARTNPVTDEGELDLRHTLTLSAETAVIVYADSGTDLGAWVISTSGARFVGLGVRSAEVTRLAKQAAFLATSLTTSDHWSNRMASLYSILVEPLAVEGFSTLVVVADGGTSNVPFDALESASGEPVSRKWTVVRAPSVAAALSLPPHVVRRGGVLLVGDPAGSALPELPGARQESETIAAVYRNANVTSLLGGQATLANFKERLPQNQIIHFSGHAYADPDNPGRSYLQFAADSASDGRWLVDDMNVGDFTSDQIVVLAACEAAQGDGDARDAVTNLADAILRAGAGSVVASLWPLPDVASAPFFVELHERLSAGDSIGTAAQFARNSGIPTEITLMRRIVAGVQVFTRSGLERSNRE